MMNKHDVGVLKHGDQVIACGRQGKVASVYEKFQGADVVFADGDRAYVPADKLTRVSPTVLRQTQDGAEVGSVKDIDITIKRLERLADDYRDIADQIGHEQGDSDALFLLKGVVIGMRRCVNELRDVEVVDPNVTSVGTSMGDLRSAIQRARGGDAPPQHKSFA